MKHRTIVSVSIAILFSLFVIVMGPGKSVMAYYGGLSSPTGNPYGSIGLGGLSGGYGLYGGMYGMLGGLYGGYGLYGGMYGGLGGLYGMYGGYGLYGGMYGMLGGLYGGYGLYGGMYGMLGGLYGGYGLYGGMYGMLGGLYGGYGLYGGMYGGLGGLYGMYGGYLGIPDLGLTNLVNPLDYYSFGGMYNLINSFDPLGDPLLGLGMFSGALF